MGLDVYHRKRDFKKTPEPKGTVHQDDSHRFVIQNMRPAAYIMISV